MACLRSIRGSFVALEAMIMMRKQKQRRKKKMINLKWVPTIGPSSTTIFRNRHWYSLHWREMIRKLQLHKWRDRYHGFGWNMQGTLGWKGGSGLDTRDDIINTTKQSCSMLHIHIWLLWFPVCMFDLSCCLTEVIEYEACLFDALNFIRILFAWICFITK